MDSEPQQSPQFVTSSELEKVSPRPYTPLSWMFRERIAICGDPDLSGPLVGRTHRFAPTTKQYLNVHSLTDSCCLFAQSLIVEARRETLAEETPAHATTGLKRQRTPEAVLLAGRVERVEHEEPRAQAAHGVPPHVQGSGPDSTLSCGFLCRHLGGPSTQGAVTISGAVARAPSAATATTV